MMRGKHKTFSRVAWAAALSAVAAGSPAPAQSVNDWSLQPETGQPTPTIQGPVDPQNPVARPTTRATPTPAPTPVPTITPPPPPATSPVPAGAMPPPQTGPASPSPARPRTTPTAAPGRPSNSQPAQVPPSASVQTPAPPLVADTPQADATAAPTQESTASALPSWPAWYWALPLAVVLGLGAALLLRRRRPEAPEEEGERLETETPPEPAAPRAQASAGPTALAPLTVPPIPGPAFAPAAPSPQQFEIAFEPVSLRLSLVFATLQYRLRLDAASDLASAQLLGDMISAHSSIPQEQQLAPSPDGLAMLHSVAALPAGDSAVLTGQLQLPLASILPLQRGNARFFVPLVRLCLIGEDGLAARRVLTIGEPGNGPGLAPFRLDTGPRDYNRIEAREVAAAREFAVAPLDPRRAAV